MASGGQATVKNCIIENFVTGVYSGNDSGANPACINICDCLFIGPSYLFTNKDDIRRFSGSIASSNGNPLGYRALRSAWAQLGATIRLQSKNYFTTHLDKRVTTTSNNWNGTNVHLNASALKWSEALTDTTEGDESLPVWRKNMSLNLIKKWFTLLEIAQSTVSMEAANNYGPNPISYYLFHNHNDWNFFEGKYPRELFHSHDLFNIFLGFSQVIALDSNSLCELNYNNINTSNWDGINPNYATKRMGFDTLCLCTQPLTKTMMNTGSSETISIFQSTEHRVRTIGDDAESWNRFYFILPPRIHYQINGRRKLPPGTTPPSVPKMEIGSWMKEFLRSDTDNTSFIPLGISGDSQLDTLYGIQCVNKETSERSLTDIQDTLSGLNSLIMPSCYDFRRFATGIWNYIYSKSPTGTESVIGQNNYNIWKDPTSGILTPLNNYFRYGSTSTHLGKPLGGLLPGLNNDERLAISGYPKDYFPWYNSTNEKQYLHCTPGYIQYLTYGIEPDEQGQNIRMLTTAYPYSRYGWYFERSYYKRLVWV